MQIGAAAATVTHDVLRNQLARNIDVMLDRQETLPSPLRERQPALSSFVLLTPELFREHPRSRLYGWLIKEYRSRPEALAEDLPHRDEDWPGSLQKNRLGDIPGLSRDRARCMQVARPCVILGSSAPIPSR